MFGLSELVTSVELRLVVSVGLALAAVVTVAFVRSARRRLVERRRPIVVDLVSSVLVVTTVVVATFALADLWEQTETLVDQLGVVRFDERAPEVVVSLVILVAVQVFVGIAARLLEDLATESDSLTDHQREVALRLTQLTLWSLGGLVILGIWDIDLTGLLVGAGFLGIVLGLASRKTLGSLLGGIVLMLSRPFEVGDWVLVDEHEGVITDIALMSTRIRGFDGEYIVVPNDVATTKTIRNRSREGRFRVTVEVGVDYDAAVEDAREAVLEATEAVAAEHEFIRTNPAPNVVARHLGDSAVVLAGRVWIDDPTARRVTRVRDDLVCAIKETCEEAAIKIPFPQRELSGRVEGETALAPSEDGTRERDEVS